MLHEAIMIDEVCVTKTGFLFLKRLMHSALHLSDCRLQALSVEPKLKINQTTCANALIPRVRFPTLTFKTVKKPATSLKKF